MQPLCSIATIATTVAVVSRNAFNAFYAEDATSSGRCNCCGDWLQKLVQ